ncbi:MAG: GntR family transcriptional regulator [Chloroflexota bacterium]
MHVGLELIDRMSSVPLYRQIESILHRELTEDGADGGRRFTESDLTERFQVSRYTIRQALAGLSGAGLIDRRRRRGTYPSPRGPIEQPLAGIYSFARGMRELGLESSTTVSRVRVIQADRALRRELRLRSTAGRVVELSRLRCVGGQPLLLETIRMPAGRLPGIQDMDLTGSVYDLLRDRYQVEVTMAQETIRPILLDQVSAALLQAPAGSPAFFVERLSFHGQEPVEVRHSTIRGDRYLYSIRLHSSDSGELLRGSR